MTKTDQNTLAATLEAWLSVDSTSGREKEFLELLEDMFRDDGWNIQRQAVEDDRWNLLVTDGHKPRLLFSTHVDTVPPFLAVRRQKDTIFGRGACDTKGGLLAMVHAARKLRDQGVEGLGFLLVVGEEVDHCGAKIARELDVQPERIILCEPTQNRVVHAQKGMIRLILRSHGVAGHSAFPDDGTSAIDPLLDAIERLRHHNWPVDDLLGPTTLNIGVLNGGVAANVFAAQAHAELLFRAVRPVAPMIKEIKTLVDDPVTIDELVFNDPVYFEPPENVATCTVPFNTDATYLSELADVWLVGPGDIRTAHSDDERIELDDITTGIKLYTDLAAEVFRP